MKEVKHNKLQPVNEEPNQWHCPECGTPCTIEWSGLDLVENTGDETLATKHYIPVKAETAAERDRLKEELNSATSQRDRLGNEYESAQQEISKLKEENERLKDALNFILNDAEPGEDAKLTIRGYNKACAALSNEDYEKYTSLQSINRDLVEALKISRTYVIGESETDLKYIDQALKNSTL